MKKLLFALFITTLVTNKAWSEEIHSAVSPVVTKPAPVAAPVKKHWWDFSKSKAPVQPKPASLKKSEGLSTKQVKALAAVLQRASYGGTMGMESFNQNMRPYEYYPINSPITATTYPGIGGTSTTYFNRYGNLAPSQFAITTPSISGGSTTYYNGF